MQRLEIRNGYVEIKDFVTRKMSREYMAILSENAHVTAEGKESVTAKGVNLASELMVLSMIERAVTIGDDGVEKQIEVDEEWLDNLPEKDFTKVSEAVLEIFNDGRKKAKK